MGKKGGNKKVKAINAPKSVFIKRKERVWSIKTQAGAHKKNSAVALGIVLRDYIKVGASVKEIKQILHAGEVKVNGVVKDNYQMGVGLFDTIDIDKQKLHNRVVFDSNGRLVLKALKKPSSEKICRVEYKQTVAKGTQITTDDGRVLFGVKANVGDGLKIKLPEGKVMSVLPLQANAAVYIINGVHCAEKGKVKEIVPGTAKREKLLRFTNGKDVFETVARNAYVIGEGEVAIEDLKE
jgi:small subunit ribosomal protein S4e